MGVKAFLGVTAVGEGVTGLGLLVRPAVPLALLLGVRPAAPATLVAGRVAGAALLAIGLMSGLVREDHGSPARRAMLSGIVVYDVLVAAVLAAAGWRGGFGGILRGPAVVAHLALAGWGGVGLRTGGGARQSADPAPRSS